VRENKGKGRRWEERRKKGEEGRRSFFSHHSKDLISNPCFHNLLTI
jgi:hypothetical protein